MKAGNGGAGGKATAAVDPKTWLAHLLGAVATAMVLLWCIHFRGGLALQSANKQLIFNIHPVLMVIGFIVIGGEGIMSYKSLPLSKEAKKAVHLGLQAIALTAGAVGICAVFKYHNESGIANMYTLHSWIGIAAISLYGLQWLLGFLAFFFPGVSMSVRRSAIPWHVVLGLLVFILAIGNAQLGFLEKLTFLQVFGKLDKLGPEALLVNFTALVVLLFGAAVIISAIGDRSATADRYTAV